jgi:hypothetical protein
MRCLGSPGLGRITDLVRSKHGIHSSCSWALAHMGGAGPHPGDPVLPAPRESSLPFTCLFWNSERKRVMRSEGMAKEMPAATLSVLMPMTSPSWAEREKCGVIWSSASKPQTAAEPRVRALSPGRVGCQCSTEMPSCNHGSLSAPPCVPPNPGDLSVLPPGKGI